MIKSRRARRMERHHKKAKTPGLNLIALMDIFTLLVFFLLVNSSSTQQIPSQKNLKLPMSASKIIPEETLIIEITDRNILIQGRSVATLDQVLASTDAGIPALKAELDFLAKNTVTIASGEPDAERKITIMGDENISYDVIRRVLTTCQQASFTKIAFTAVQKTNRRS